jgi:hypothetical protein
VTRTTTTAAGCLAVAICVIGCAAETDMDADDDRGDEGGTLEPAVTEADTKPAPGDATGTEVTGVYRVTLGELSCECNMDPEVEAAFCETALSGQRSDPESERMAWYQTGGRLQVPFDGGILVGAVDADGSFALGLREQTDVNLLVRWDGTLTGGRIDGAMATTMEISPAVGFCNVRAPITGEVLWEAPPTTPAPAGDARGAAISGSYSVLTGPATCGCPDPGLVASECPSLVALVQSAKLEQMTATQADGALTLGAARQTSGGVFANGRFDTRYAGESLIIGFSGLFDDAAAPGGFDGLFELGRRGSPCVGRASLMAFRQ